VSRARETFQYSALLSELPDSAVKINPFSRCMDGRGLGLERGTKKSLKKMTPQPETTPGIFSLLEIDSA
jgi:hypothetical protein